MQRDPDTMPTPELKAQCIAANKRDRKMRDPAWYYTFRGQLWILIAWLVIFIGGIIAIGVVNGW